MITKNSVCSNKILLSVFDSLPCEQREIDQCYKDIQRKANKLALQELNKFFDHNFFIYSDKYIDYNSIVSFTVWPLKDEALIYDLVGYIRSFDDKVSIKFRVVVYLS